MMHPDTPHRAAVASPFLIVCVLVCVLAPTSSIAQTAANGRPIPYPVTPPPGYQRAIQAGTRTTTGEPGPRYWQQWTSYVIRAQLDPTAKRLTGSARIVYHNNSPDVLPVVSVQLLQNLHAEGAIRNESEEVTGGVHLGRVFVNGRVVPDRPAVGPGYFVDGTAMAIRLAEPLQPRDSLRLAIEWSFTVPQNGAGRMGWSRDDLFMIAYWYPQMAVYDDVVGWQTDLYRGRAEFYMGYGDYDVTLNMPQGWVVRATGQLTNPQEVLPQAVLDRLDRASRSDTVVHVLSADEFGPGKATRTTAGGMLQWHFVADSVRDFTFSATSESRWDATRTPVGDRDGDGEPDYALIETLYRSSAPLWSRSWRYAQHSIDFLSRWTQFPYPWPHMTAVEGAGIITGGMEFPMMTLIGDYRDRGDSALYYVTAHELAHMWVPMIVGSDEKRYAWMDEGTTTFNENQARKEFFPGSNPDSIERASYLETAQASLEGEMMRWSDYQYTSDAYTTASYSKPATLLAALRGLLGEDTFRHAFTQFINEWAFKHPKPWDLFETFNTVSGQDLDWFWRTWYYETWTLDQAVGEVGEVGKAREAREARETRITVEDHGLAPMPARLTITLANGTTLKQEVPVSTWLAGATTATVTVSTPSPVVRVEIDAEHVFPDVDRRNNVWRQ